MQTISHQVEYVSRKTQFTWGRLQELKNAHNSITIQNRTHVHMNFFCLKSHILSFPKVLQIPPESPCIYWSFSFHFLLVLLEEYWRIWKFVVCTCTYTCWYCKSVIPYLLRKLCQDGFTRSHELMLHRHTVCWDVEQDPLTSEVLVIWWSDYTKSFYVHIHESGLSFFMQWIIEWISVSCTISL